MDIATIRKKQLTYQQRREIIQILILHGLRSVQLAVRHAQCSTRTVWNIWGKYAKGGKTDETIALARRCPRHPAEHTQAEHDLIVKLIESNPKTSYIKLYTELTAQGYTRSYKGMWGYIDKHNLHGKNKVEYTPRINKPYETPPMLGFKWQMDVKYVPKPCIDGRAYQFTMIDEATRMCFEMAFPEKSTHSTRQFILHAIEYFGYKPLQIQTDNGTEFTNSLVATKKEHMINAVDRLLNDLHIEHKLIRPATPRHNGKVERRHREDDKNYQGKTFDSLANLNSELFDWCNDKNNTFTFALCKKCQKSPNMRRAELLKELQRFGYQTLGLRRQSNLQELIYAYAEFRRINQEKQLLPPKFIIHLPNGIELLQDIQQALARYVS